MTTNKTYQIVFDNKDNSHNINVSRPSFTVFAKSYQEAIGHILTGLDCDAHNLKLYEVIEVNYPQPNKIVWNSSQSKQDKERAEQFRQSILN